MPVYDIEFALAAEKHLRTLSGATMKTVEVPSANKQLRKMLAQAQSGTLVLTEDGKPVAALVALEGMDAELLALGADPKFLGILRRSFRQLDTGQAISLAEMRKRLRMKK